MTRSETLSLLVSLALGHDLPAPVRTRARLFASSTGEAVLWHHDAVRTFADGPGRWMVELPFELPADARLFSTSTRFVSIWVGAEQRWTPRAPFSGESVRRAVALGRLEDRLAALEAAWNRAGRLQVLTELRDALDDHERRLRQVEALEPVHALQDASLELAGRAERTEGRLVRIEDELEDLVGKDGDVVDFEERIGRLERVLFGPPPPRDAPPSATGSQDPLPLPRRGGRS
jgi:hypothetical protein